MMGRWKNRPEGANWGDFGPDDQLGRLNLLTPERRRAAAAEVREGVCFGLSLPLDYPGGNVLNPRRFPPQLSPTERDGEATMNFPMARLDPANTDVVNDDRVLLSLQYSTQWDSLAHIGAQFDADGDGVAEKVYYNGYRAHEHVLGPGDGGETGALALGIDTMAATPIQGRGVMVDFARHFGTTRKLIGYDELMAVLDADGIDFETGDIFVMRTGFPN